MIIFFLEIVRPPVISAINRNVEQPEGVTASLECTVQGNDQDSNRPQITWNREGNNLPSKARVSYSLYSNIQNMQAHRIYR